MAQSRPDINNNFEERPQFEFRRPQFEFSMIYVPVERVEYVEYLDDLYIDLKYKPYREHPLTLAFAFLGVLPRRLDGYEQSWANIGYNLIGWQPNAPGWKKVINGFLAPFAVIFNIALAVPKCAINIVKLVTEFLPCFLACSFFSIYDRNMKRIEDARNNSKKYSDAEIRIAKAAVFFAGACFIFFNALSFIGGAITSPLVNAQRAFRFGQTLAGVGAGGKILGVVLAGISTIISLSVYIIVAPMALNFVAATIFPGLATALPPFLLTIGNFLQPAVSAIYGAASGISMAYVGLSALVAAAITPVGHGLFELKNLIVNEWYENKSKKNRHPVVNPPVMPSSDITITGALRASADRDPQRKATSDPTLSTNAAQAQSTQGTVVGTANVPGTVYNSPLKDSKVIAGQDNSATNNNRAFRGGAPTNSK